MAAGGLVLLFVGGFLAILVAAMGQTIDEAGTVMCGHLPMRPGDSCVTVGGAGGTETYEQVRATRSWQESVSTNGRPTVLAVSVMCLSIGALLFVGGVVRYYRTSPSPGSLG